MYSALLMMSLTLTFGTTLTGLALGQFGAVSNSGSVGASIDQQSSGTQIAYLFDTVSSQAGCPLYGGAPEGTVLSLTIFDYGSAKFTPTQLVVNSTLYFGSFPASLPGAMSTLSLTLTPSGSCAHPSGQTVLLVDTNGDEVQFAT